MIRRLLCFLLMLLVLPGASCTRAESKTVFPPEEYEFAKRVSVRYESETLIYTIESFALDGVPCLLTKVWVRDPERQIRKANASWGEDLDWPLALAKQIPGTVLATNASGYITRQYPDIPESYPGVPEDYFFTTLGSLVVTEGEVLRNLENVPFYGLALSKDGISLYRGVDNEQVLATAPLQTWAFFESSAMQEGGEDVLPEEGTWPVAKEQHPRTILARVNRNNYLMLHVPNRKDSYGLSLYRINRFFTKNFETEWVYNLDGGYSTELIYRSQKENARLTQLARCRQKSADILCITE